MLFSPGEDANVQYREHADSQILYIGYGNFSVRPAPSVSRGVGVNELTEKLGRRVKELRTRRGLTQAQLAERAGVSQTTLSRLEGGHQCPSLHGLATLAEALGVSLPTVVDFEGERLGQVDLIEALMEHATGDADQLTSRLRDALVALFPEACSGDGRE